MDTLVVIFVNHNSTLQAEVEQCFVDVPYKLISHSQPEDARQALALEPPTAIVVILPSDAPREQEQALMAQLQSDPDAQQIPVLVCSDQPAVLRSAVHALQQRPGKVHASSTDAKEILAQLQAFKENNPHLANSPPGEGESIPPTP